MDRPPEDASFPGRISHTFAVAVGVVVAAVLLVGGTSLVLAARIYLDNDAVMQEYDHILRLDEVHSVFDDLILALHQMDSTGRLDRTTDALLLQEEIVRQLAALGETHRGELGAAEQQHLAVLGSLRRLSEEGLVVTKRLATGTGRLAEIDLAWLDRASHEVPRHTGMLSEFHRSRIAHLLKRSQHLIQAIFALYVAFLVVGGALVVAASLAANHGIAAPLHRLADAAQGLAEGRLETRVRVRSANEIGLLSHVFNLMADRLQERERELRRAQGALEEKVREAQALYDIGMEISRLQKLDRILQSVVDKARELLRGDAVALCLFSPGGGELAAQATSGAPEALRAPGEAGEARPAEGVESGDAVGLVIRPEYARAHLAAPLRVGNEIRGAIYVAAREEREFTAGEAALLAGLATQAAIAIERARLSEEVRGLAAVEERERLAREMHDGLAQALGRPRSQAPCHTVTSGSPRRSAR
jgi:HAMP domain-containing protein